MHEYGQNQDQENNFTFIPGLEAMIFLKMSLQISRALMQADELLVASVK